MSARSIRVRFLVAIGLLLATTVAASAWTLIVLGRLGTATGAMLRATDASAAAASAVTGAIEREDDALLLGLAHPERGQTALVSARATTDRALGELRAILTAGEHRERARRIDERLASYRAAADALSGKLEGYHAEVNPKLRVTVADIVRVREEHFAALGRAAEVAQDAVFRTRRAVAIISTLALIFALLIALGLSRALLVPLRALAEGANAIREGNFDARIEVPREDEIGQVAIAFNEMAVRLSQVRRSNIEEVLRAKGTLESMTGALPDAVLLLGEGGAVVSSNPATRALFRALGREAPKTVADLAPLGIAGPADGESMVELKVGEETRRYRRRIIPAAGGAPSGKILVLTDVTELVRLDQMRLELVAVASHELRTPVTTLRMCLSMLREKAAALAPELREVVSTAMSGVDQLGETVDELLDMSQIEAGKLKLDAEPLDVRKAAEESAARARARATELGVAISLALPAGPAMAIADRARLRLVFTNVLENALKYTPRGGRVEIAVGSPLASAVEVSITDTGIGIPEELRPHVFEKFFRVEHHVTRPESAARGTGIGLYLCREIVRLHGGAIACSAAPEGQGTRITFSLPALVQGGG